MQVTICFVSRNDSRVGLISIYFPQATRMLHRYLLPLAAGVLAAQPSFFSEIRPILQKQCAGCHRPGAAASDLDVTTFTAFKKGGKRGPGTETVLAYITGEARPRMPMGSDPLPDSEIARIKAWLAAGASDDTPVETDSGPSVYLQLPVITALRFSPDGGKIAVSGNREILLHDATGASLLKRLPGKAERILSINFSADGKTLIAGGGTPAQFGEVQVWDVESGKPKASARLTNDTVFGASISPDASKIAVGCADNTVHVFDTATAKELYKIGNHENWVLATVFGVDSKRFVSVGRDRAAKLIDSNSGAFLENVNLLRGELSAVARHPKKDVVVIGGEDRYPYIYVMDRGKNMKIADDSTLLRKLDRQNGTIVALDWSSDGRTIAVAGAAPEVNLYNADTGERTAQCKGHSAGIYSLHFSPDGKQLATGGFDGMVRIYDSGGCQLLRSFAPVPLSAGVPK